LLTLNFERNPEYSEAFVSNDPVQIQTVLALMSGKKIIPGKTLLFLDEIQASPVALAALRYFYEEVPELHLLAAGSLLEFALEDAQFSMPVGRIDYLHLGAMQFEDFVGAMGQADLQKYLQQISLEDIGANKFPRPIHEKCLALLRQYWIVGGMPEAVASYVETGDFEDVARVHQSILATYRDDFNKYSQGSLKHRVQLVFDRLPSMVGRKFKYAQVSRDHRAAEIEAALQQLCMARVASRVMHSSANGVPLGAESNHRVFKVLYMDIGLMSSALSLNLLNIAQDDLSMINDGALAEQFIGQQLLYSRHYFENPALFYWVREAKSAAAEIDYLLTCYQHIVPVEIKAGKTGTLKSLHQFLKEKQRQFALRFNADVPSLLVDKKKLTDGVAIEYELLSLPLYLVGQAQRLMQLRLREL
jgi:predicted AAA+ superfamily ATPase